MPAPIDDTAASVPPAHANAPSTRPDASRAPAAAPPATPDAPPVAAIALLSAAALGYEILLMRLFSIVQWHHFAYMMISVALLGYGAAGTFVTLGRTALVARYRCTFVAAAVAFGVTSVVAFLLAQRVAFNPLELLWDPAQALRLAVVYGLLVVPFFCAALPLCLTYTRFGEDAPRVYSYDILGAGAGCLAILGVLFAVAPARALTIVGGMALAAAGAAALQLRSHPQGAAIALFAAAIALPPLLPTDWIALRPSPYKDLSQALQVDGARVVAERSSPLGLVTVVESPRVPFRHAPGLSLRASIEPPPQLAFFVDGDGPSALNRFEGRREPLAYLDELTSAAPYHLLAHPRVLVLGAGPGADVLQALYHGARSIDAVELDPLVVDLVDTELAAFSGRPYRAPGVRLHVAEARGFVARTRDRYDLIEVALLDAFGASSAGLYALSESYLYTVEAFGNYLDRLAPNGILAITRWVNLPPRDTLKLFATAVTALERRGVTDPGTRLALVRSFRTVTLLVKNGALAAEEIAALESFCETRSFDTDYFPGIAPAQANRHSVVTPSHFHDGALALLGPERERYLERYKYAIAPATDDRPHFFHFFKWATLPEFIALGSRGGLPLVEWGYPVLVATLVQAAVAGMLLVLLPLAVGDRALRGDGVARRGGGAARGEVGGNRATSRLPVALYFAAIGFAFMFVEMAFIQKFVLFLSHPLYAVAVVLCAFLVFAGLGSRWSQRMHRDADKRFARAIVLPAAAIAVLALGYVAILPRLVEPLAALPDAARIAIAMLLIAPLAFAMGMPFPLGLARLAARAAPLVPWAWGINACASVVAAVLATLLAIHLGFALVVLIAVSLYALAALAARWMPS